MRMTLRGLQVLGIVLIGALSAFADGFGPVTLGITNAPCQGGVCVAQFTNIATVTGTTVGSGPNFTQFQFTVTALPGYSIQLQSNKFFDFNTNIVPLSALSLDQGQVTVFSGGTYTGGVYTGGSSANVQAAVLTDVQGQAGTGQFDLGLNDLSKPPTIGGNKVTGAAQIQFTIDLTGNADYSSLSAANFYPQPNSDGWNFEMHFCDGTGPSCTSPTGFVVDTGTPTVPTPEPGSLGLLAMGFAGLPLWRRIRRQS